MLRDRALREPDRLAFAFLRDADNGAASLTFGELDRKARAIAAHLQGRMGAEERALLLYPAGLDYVAAFYGCLYAGIIAVPLYPPHRRQRPLMESILGNCGSRTILTTGQVRAKVQATLGDDSPAGPLAFISTDEIPDQAAAEWEQRPVEGNAVAYLQYTSGSTSAPRGVVINHSMALYQCEELAHSWGVGRDSVLVSWLPHFHDFGQVAGVLMPVFLGIRSVLMSPASFIQQPLRWLEAISKYRGSHSAAPNFAYDHCVDNIPPEAAAGLELSCWLLASNGAEPVRRTTLDRFYAAFASKGLRWETLSPGYGLAEATLKVTSNRWDVPLSSKVFDPESLRRNQVRESSGPNGRVLVGCGGTVMSTRVVIVDPQTRRQVSANEVGEIWVSGPGVSHGYWNSAEQTKQTFQAYLADTGAGPFLRTGDLGFMDDGDLYISGRLKDLVVVRGANHYPQDIELTAEQAHPILRPGYCAAFSVDRDDVEKLVVVAERKRFYPHPFEPDDVLLAIRRAISREHGLDVAAVWLLRTGTVSRTSSGKIQRQECKSRFLAGELTAVAKWNEPAVRRPSALLNTQVKQGATATLQDLIRAGTEAQLIDWIASRGEVGRAAIDMGRSLTAHGLSSLDMLELHGNLETWLGREVPPEWLWDSPSIDALVNRLSGRSSSASIDAQAPVSDGTHG
jgi:acyl-CoA synthetase (AMP-forming)/AMP-acid ligase II/acyl carrier protein